MNISVLNLVGGQPDNYGLNTSGLVNSNFIHFFYFININSINSNPLVINGSNYAGYFDFVTSGITPTREENIFVSDDTASVSVIKTAKNLTLDINVTNRPLPEENYPYFIQGRVEIWSKVVNVDRIIPASRLITKVNFTGTNDGIGSGFKFVGGNPANRSYLGILQPNGYYKSQFPINLPSVNSDSLLPHNGNFYDGAIINSYSVPSAPDFIS